MADQDGGAGTKQGRRRHANGRDRQGIEHEDKIAECGTAAHHGAQQLAGEKLPGRRQAKKTLEEIADPTAAEPGIRKPQEVGEQALLDHEAQTRFQE